jgi:hypothetical protein
VCLTDKDIKQADWPFDKFTVYDLEALDEAGLAMFSRASGVTNMTSFARLANVIANSVNVTPDQQLIALYLLRPSWRCHWRMSKVALAVACHTSAIGRQLSKSG